MKYLLIVLVIAVMSSCATPQAEVIVEKPQLKVSVLTLPVWFLEPPSGNYVLGISRLSFKNLEMETAAFQNAVVSYCRNHNSYIVNNQALRESEIVMTASTANFRVIVSSEPQKLQEVKEKLEKLDSFWFYDNYVGLYGIKNSVIDKRRIELEIVEEADAKDPGWYKDGLEKKEDEILAAGNATSYDAVSAWGKALDSVRVKLAGYMELDVGATVYHINEMEDKLITLETTKRMGAMNLKR